MFIPISIPAFGIYYMTLYAIGILPLLYLPFYTFIYYISFFEGTFLNINLDQP